MPARGRRPEVAADAGSRARGADVADAVRAERERIARELHDGVIQSLYALGLGLEATIQALEGDVPLARMRLVLMRDSINNVIREVRTYVGDLRAEAGPAPGLATQFADVARELALNLTVEVAPAVERALPPDQRRQLYLIGREALLNVAKHARATRVRLGLVPLAGARGAGAWVLRIRDDGVGFAPGPAAPTSFGLRTMRERARALGAELSVTSRPGGGTKVRVVHP